LYAPAEKRDYAQSRFFAGSARVKSIFGGNATGDLDNSLEEFDVSFAEDTTEVAARR
jgi:hypothetical protein